MDPDETQHKAVELAGLVKARMVDFATSPPFERHLRHLLHETIAMDPHVHDPDVRAVELLLFEFRYDDNTTVIDRFVQLPTLSTPEREMAIGFSQGVAGFFEVVEETPPGAAAFRVRCCLSDLEHVVAPTELTGVPALAPGSFLTGRFNPITGTELWTPSGVLEVIPASRRDVVAEVVMEMALQAPWLTHRNPEKARAATEQTRQTHERFIERHISDLVIVDGKDLPAVYAEAVAAEGTDSDVVADARSLARQTIEDSELVHAGRVALLSHPVAGFSFYLGFEHVTRALDDGDGATLYDLVVLQDYLDDEGVPVWLLRRIIEDRLPTSSAALAQALKLPDFDWERDGEQMLAETPGDQEPVLTLAIVPSMCNSGS